MRLTMAAAAVALVTGAGTALGGDDVLARGEYLARIMDCGGCHTRGALLGAPDPALELAGSEVGFFLPGLGIFWPPNLTGDETTGLGAWTEEEIARAVTEGVRPDGRILAPAMPWRSYAGLGEDDARALAAYLKSLPARPFAAEPQPVADTADAKAPYLTVTVPE
jgi:mono/diheme cytochrome c family protein